MRWLTLALLLAGMTLLADESKKELADPVHVLAASKPLDVQRSGHAAPFVGDLDGDGLPDLLVGQYHEGRLRIYRNVGTRKSPRFDSFNWLLADGKFARVPVG